MTSRLLLAAGATIALASLAVGFAACSGDSSAAATDPDAAGGGEAGDGTESGGGPTTGDGSVAADGSTPAGSDIPKPTACPTSKYKTLVIVGDSISDVGGQGGTTNQQPFYRTLLVKNDDTLYPEWKGFDLSTCWGLDPTMNVVKASKGGAVATVPMPNAGTDQLILLNQATGLPAALPGPVLVIGTIGGNDVTGGLVTVLTGTPAELQTKIDSFAAGFGMAMAELSKTDRFGAGVKTDVLITNIYDPSGGTGHFYYQPSMATCPGALGFWPDMKATAPLLASWNTAMATEAAKYTGVKLVELAAPFKAHAVSVAPPQNWFFQDCIHPDTMGHDAIRGIFWAAMVAL